MPKTESPTTIPTVSMATRIPAAWLEEIIAEMKKQKEALERMNIKNQSNLIRFLLLEFKEGRIKAK